MKISKGVVAAAFAFVLAFVLAACGGSVGSSASMSADSANASSESASAANESGSAAGASLNINSATASTSSASAGAASGQAAEVSEDEKARVLMGNGLTTTFVASDVTDATVTSRKRPSTSRLAARPSRLPCRCSSTRSRARWPAWVTRSARSSA